MASPSPRSSSARPSLCARAAQRGEGLCGSGQRDRPRKARLVGLARRAWAQRRAGAGAEPLDLAALLPPARRPPREPPSAAGGLEPKAQARQRGPELVRRVRHEVPLGGEDDAQPVGHVVEGDRDLALLARPRDLPPSRRGRLPRRGERCARAREAASRASRDEPRQAQSDEERERPDPDQRREPRCGRVVCTASMLCVTRTAPTVRPLFVTGTAVYRRSWPRVSL